MAEYSIYNKSGNEICKVHQLEYSGTLMSDRTLTVSVKSPTHIAFEPGCYIDYRSERFTLDYEASVKKIASAGSYGEAFTYDAIAFKPYDQELKDCCFFDGIKSSAEGEGTMYTGFSSVDFWATSVQTIADRVRYNLDRIYRDSDGSPLWEVVVHEDGLYGLDDDAKRSVAAGHKFSFKNVKVWDVLTTLNSTWGVVYRVTDSEINPYGRVLHFGYEDDTPESPSHTFSYGKGNGLKELEKIHARGEEITTALRAYGSTKNLSLDYYRLRNIKFQCGIDKINLVDGNKIVNGSISGTSSSVAPGKMLTLSKDTFINKELKGLLSSVVSNGSSSSTYTGYRNLDYVCPDPTYYAPSAETGIRLIGKPTIAMAFTLKGESVKGIKKTLLIGSYYESGSNILYGISLYIGEGGGSVILECCRRMADGTQDSSTVTKLCRKSFEPYTRYSLVIEGDKVTVGGETINMGNSVRPATPTETGSIPLLSNTGTSVNTYRIPGRVLVFLGSRMFVETGDRISWTSVYNDHDGVCFHSALLTTFKSDGTQDTTYSFRAAASIEGGVQKDGIFVSPGTPNGNFFYLSNGKSGADIKTESAAYYLKVKPRWVSTRSIGYEKTVITNAVRSVYLDEQSAWLTKALSSLYIEFSYLDEDTDTTYNVYSMNTEFELKMVDLIEYNSSLEVDTAKYGLREYASKSTDYVLFLLCLLKYESSKLYLKDGASMYFTAGIDKTKAEARFLDTPNIEYYKGPTNATIANLMLPGYPENSKDPFITSYNGTASQRNYEDFYNERISYTDINDKGFKENVVFFDGSDEDLGDIYPTIDDVDTKDLVDAGLLPSTTTQIGLVNEVMSADEVKEPGIYDGGKQPEKTTFAITIKDLGFNPQEYLTSGETLTVNMEDGMCGGRSFEVTAVSLAENGGYILTLKKCIDNNCWYPNVNFNIKAKDKFNLTGMSTLPDTYVRVASQRLLRKALSYYKKHRGNSTSYKVVMDNIFLARHPEIVPYLREGNLMYLITSDKGYRPVRSVGIPMKQITIREGESLIPEYEILLSDNNDTYRLDKRIEKKARKVVINASVQETTSVPSASTSTSTSEISTESTDEGIYTGSSTAVSKIKIKNGTTEYPVTTAENVIYDAVAKETAKDVLDKLSASQSGSMERFVINIDMEEGEWEQLKDLYTISNKELFDTLSAILPGDLYKIMFKSIYSNQYFTPTEVHIRTSKLEFSVMNKESMGRVEINNGASYDTYVNVDDETEFFYVPEGRQGPVYDSNYDLTEYEISGDENPYDLIDASGEIYLQVNKLN